MDGQPQRRSWTSRISIVRRLRRKNKKDGGVGVRTLADPRNAASGNHDDINELGERQDPTDMMHSLSIRDSMDSLLADDALEYDMLDDNDPRVAALRRRREAMLASIPRGIWDIITRYLSPADCAQLALANKLFLEILGDKTFATLDDPENQVEKLEFLGHLNRHLPNHLLCFVCARHHRRLGPGMEKVPTATSENPVVACPAANLRISLSQRTKLTHSRILPYAFVQLPLRAHRYGLTYGIPADRLAREWTKTGSDGGQPRWRHSTRYVVGVSSSKTRRRHHLLLRVRSHTFAPPNLPPAGMRHLLYEREEYTPYFSVCPHWADGELMAVCKCALSHVPEARPRGVAEQIKRAPQALAQNLVHARNGGGDMGGGGGGGGRECSFCQTARRCPKCPSEYLVKMTLVEDRHSRDPQALFKFALVVTRYVDLGDGSGPGLSPEWDAVNGVYDGYDSIAMVGRRSIMGTFESIASGPVPGMPRMINMNPHMHTGGKDGD